MPTATPELEISLTEALRTVAKRIRMIATATLAAAGISGFSKIFSFVEQNAPLRRNVTIDDVGNVAAFLLSDLAAGVTSEITYVDAGFSHVMGGVSAAATQST